jgi:hypothetical protein
MSTTLTYAMLVEVAPGVHRPAILCNSEDLARAQALEARREGLLVEVRHLIEEAYLYDLHVPQDLREALAEWVGGIPELETLRDALAGALAGQPL